MWARTELEGELQLPELDALEAALEIEPRAAAAGGGPAAGADLVGGEISASRKKRLLTNVPHALHRIRVRPLAHSRMAT